MNVIIMENDKVKKKKRGIRLTEEERKKIYKEEKKKRQDKYVAEIMERSTVVFGSVLLAIYIVISSLIISVGLLLYLVALATDEMQEAYASNPFGVTGNIAFFAIMGFTFWVMFGFFSLMLFIKSNEILKKKPELYKKLKIWNWRK